MFSEGLDWARPDGVHVPDLAKSITQLDEITYEIKELEKIIEETDRYAREKYLSAFSGCSQKFQELILDISGNSQLIRVRKNICDQSHRYRIRSLNSPKRLEYSLKEHRDIFEAIKKKDPEKAEKLSQIHTENVYKNILAHIEKNGDVKL